MKSFCCVQIPLENDLTVANYHIKDYSQKPSITMGPLQTSGPWVENVHQK